MVKQEIVDKIVSTMHNSQNIRNISVIAHVDHGKSTLTDSLVMKAGLISKDKAGQTRFTDFREDEKNRTITIKSTGVAMVFDVPVPQKPGPNFDPTWVDRHKRKPSADSSKPSETSAAPSASNSEGSVGKYTERFLVNLIDSPGHVDFSSEVTAALRVSDGAVVVVDCIEGVQAQTQTVLRQALAERIKPVLFLNKLDRIFTELQMDPEVAFQTLRRTVESVNVIISLHQGEAMGDVSVWPENGSVGFGSGLQGWGFTLENFAEFWHDKFNISVKKLTKKLWGDHFYDAVEKKWYTEQAPKGKKLPRGFNFLVLEPLQRLFKSAQANDTDAVNKFLANVGVALPKTEEEITGKKLLKPIMQAWLPAADALLQMITRHLPSPPTAQRYRVETLYDGPLDDEAATAIRNCDPNGPLMMYVSKMIPTSDNSRFIAYGRVFSGTVSSRQAVRIQGPGYHAEPGLTHKTDLAKTSIQGTVLMLGPFVENVSSFPCGTLCGLVGVDDYLQKNGTITTLDSAYNFHMMKYSVAPIVRVAVKPKNPAHLDKLSKGLRRLVKADPLVQVIQNPVTNEHIICGCGELHLEICLKDLQDDFMNGCPIEKEDPVVSYCETVTDEGQICMAKSSNKHNRIHLKAAPLSEELSRAIEGGEVGSELLRQTNGASSLSKKLREEYKWEGVDVRKIWQFGPTDAPATVLVDSSKAIDYLSEVKEMIGGSFLKNAVAGVLTGEPLRGVRFDVCDAKLHADAVHRSARHIEPATKQVMAAAQLAAKPQLLEPIYLCVISVPRAQASGVYATLHSRRATIKASEEKDMGADMTRIEAYLPVAESFGFVGLLRRNTSGQAFAELMFDHWSLVPGDVAKEDTLAHKTMMAIRKRKKMSLDMPQLADYNDRL